MPPLFICETRYMEQKLNTKNTISYLLFLFIGLSIGFVIGNYTKPKTETEKVNINYDSICLRTLKEYYINQNPKERKKLIDTAAKKLAIDNMMSN